MHLRGIGVRGPKFYGPAKRKKSFGPPIKGEKKTTTILNGWGLFGPSWGSGGGSPGRGEN